MSKRFHLIHDIRPVIAGGWIVGVCLWYAYSYIMSLWMNYPVLHELQRLGLGEMLRRLFMP